MKSSVTKTFRKRLSDLPASVQEQAAKADALWQENPYHPSLQFKRVSQRQPIYSARVSLNWGGGLDFLSFLGFFITQS